MTHVSANLINDAFRGYEDDVAGGIASQTAIAAVDTNWSQDVDAKFHIAMLATETAGAETKAEQFAVQYNLNGGGWLDVTTSTPIQSVAATNCTTTDASGYGTTALTTGATIQATEYDTDGGISVGTVLNSSSFEYTSCLQIDSAQVANSDTIQLRLTDNGTALNADTTIVTITVVEAANTNVTATADALVLAGQTATVSNDTDIAAGTDALVTATFAATVDLNSDTSITTTVDTLTLSGQTATLVRNVDVQTGTDTLVIAGQTASVANDTDISATADALVIAGQTASVANDTDIAAGVDSLVIAGQTAAIQTTGSTTVSATTDALTLTGQTATIVKDSNVFATTDALTLAEQTATVSLDVDITASVDALVVVGQTATIVVDVDVQAGVATLTQTGQTATVSLDVDVQAGTAALTISSAPATVDVVSGTNVVAITDALTLTGQTATISSDKEITVGTVEMTLTGLPANIEVSTYNVSCTLVDRNGTALKSLSNISWAWFDQTDPVSMVAPVAQGQLESTSAAGLIEIDLPTTELSLGQTGTLVLRSDDGSLFGAYNLDIAA